MLEQVAEKYYLQGYNCAESLFLAGNEYYQLGLDQSSSNAVSVFNQILQGLSY